MIMRPEFLLDKLLVRGQKYAFGREGHNSEGCRRG